MNQDIPQSPYSEKFIQDRKDEIEKHREKVLSKLKELAVYDEGEGAWKARGVEYDEGDSESPEDESVEAAETIDRQGQVNSLKKELEEMDAALERIEKGTYGWDSEKEKYIAKERLKVYPTAARSIT